MLYTHPYCCYIPLLPPILASSCAEAAVKRRRLLKTLHFHYRLLVSTLSCYAHGFHSRNRRAQPPHDENMILDFGFDLGGGAAAAPPPSAASLCSSSSNSTVVFTLKVARVDENLNLRLPSQGSTGCCWRSSGALQPASNASNTPLTSDRRTQASP
jgi:hypothetical protein